MRLIQAAAAVALASAAVAPVVAAAQQPQVAVPAVQGTLLTVSADGKVQGMPDMATLNLGVTTQADTAAAALAENSRRMEQLTQALRRAGVAERDIQTSNVSVYPQQQYRENEPPLTTGYQAQNSVTAKVRRIDTTGRVIDAAVNAGGNTVNGVFFSYQNPDEQLDAARRAAIEEARRRAEIYASALGMRVTRVVAVQEGGGFQPPYPVPMMMERAQDASPAPPPPPIAPGEIETTATVSVTFELQP